MTLLKHELRKILTFPALIGFIVLALALNIVVVSTMRNEYAAFIAEASRTTGIHLNADFDARTALLTEGTYNDVFANLLRVQTLEMPDVLYGYTTGYIADSIVWRLGLSGLPERLMREKFQQFQYAVDARQQAGDSMNLYFAGATFNQHERLFEYTMGLLLFQGIILAALIMLHSVGYEFAAKTDYIVYATKTGRKINRHKLAAGLLVGVGAYILLAAVTLVIYFAFNPMGVVWLSSVSSGFNFVRDGMMTRPFVTWLPLTVRGYLLASLGISLGLVLCFGLMGYAAGLWIKNSYLGFMVLVAVNGVLFLFPYYSPWWMVNYIVMQGPIMLVVMRGLWFTDGGANVLWPHFEIVGVVGSLVVLVFIGVAVSFWFKRRQLT